MVLKYTGRIYKQCDMCSKTEYQHIYLDDKESMKSLFPEVNWKKQEICEQCAQRESGKKNWEKVRRNNGK